MTSHASPFRKPDPVHWNLRKFVALTWVLVVLAGPFLLLFFRPPVLSDFWYTLVPPYVTASLLGIWLIAGIGPVWLRLLGMVVGQSVLILIMTYVWNENPVGFAPGLAATTAVTALGMLGLGCLGSLLPIQSSWHVRIALWEIVISIGLIGVALAILRIVSETHVWDWRNWAQYTGIHYLVFSVYTGVLMLIVLLPLLIKQRGLRVLSVVFLLVAVALVPALDFWTFHQFNLRVSNMNLFYAAHIGQTVMALAIIIPMVLCFPGVLVRQTIPPGKTTEPSDPDPREEDFADLQ